MDAFVSFSLGKFNSRTVGKTHNFEFHEVEIHFIMPHKNHPTWSLFFKEEKKRIVFLPSLKWTISSSNEKEIINPLVQYSVDLPRNANY